jgi:hypothetical protein
MEGHRSTGQGSYRAVEPLEEEEEDILQKSYKSLAM